MDEHLSHHGILGQKWGVRRFQNEDGTLTPAGMKRYRYNESNGTLSESGQKRLVEDQLKDKLRNKEYREYAKKQYKRLRGLRMFPDMSAYASYIRDREGNAISKREYQGYVDYSDYTFLKFKRNVRTGMLAVGVALGALSGVELSKAIRGDSLFHHGILGQKWGVRRFRNKDGTLTSEGKKRYGNDKIQKGKTSAQKESEARKKQDVKNRGTLTTQQLQEKIQRLQMEKQLKDLTESELSSGRKAAKQALTSIGTKVAVTALSGAALYGLKALVSKKFDSKELGNAIFNGGPKKK